DEASQKLTDIHSGIDSTLMILQHRLKANQGRPAIQVHKEYGDLPPISCHPSQLNQVFMNLLANAIDALEETCVGHSYEALEANPPAIVIRTIPAGRPDQPTVTIEIQDNGPGIPQEAATKLFDPFFTTKPVGKGTGLGLSISYRIVTVQHQGKLSYRSDPEEGTTFVIDLPALIDDLPAA
ncbi:MAG: ATP-binding protein, partial [Cyanobacteria bacterium P01_H01_bin.130]